MTLYKGSSKKVLDTASSAKKKLPAQAKKEPVTKVSLASPIAHPPI